MAQLNLMPNLPQFDAYSEPSSIATRWKEWLEQFEIFTIAAKVEDKKQKRALLLHLSGPTVQKVFKGLTDTGDDYDTAAAKLHEYFAPKKHIRYERYHFKQACQQDGESIDQFASRLRNLAETCEFENIDDVIADQILANCSSNRLKEKILREEKADLTFILKQGRILECSKQQAARIGTNSPTTPEISAIQATPANRPLTTVPAFGKSCRSCGKQNHFARVCRSRPQNRNTQRQGQQRPRREQLNQISEDIVSDDEEGYIYATNTDGEHANVISRPQLPVVINGVEIVMIDSGASVNILDKAAYEQIVTQNDHIQLQKTSTRIYAYGAAEPLALLGKFQATIETLSSKTNDPDVKPVAQLPRRIPFHIRKQVEQEIESLEQQGIIEAVDGPTPWVSPVVAVPKTSNPKEIRLCVDLRQPNKAVQRQRHPTPTIEEVTNDLNGASVFSKLDLRSGYHQIELTPASRLGSFQQVIQQALQGIPGVKNISDDIIVFGRTQEEHDAALADTFQRLREKGLTLNGSKCVYNKQNLAFFGYVFSAKGMSADPKKIAAICDATPPTNPSEVRSFLGLTGFCSRFIPNYATLTEPLKHLTRKGVRWNWGVQQNKSFLALKECLTSNRTMAYFDPSKRTIATFDASPFGLGAVLTQVDADGQERSVAYASRTLSDVERRYSQTEREALAIVWGCERFHLYLYGSQFEIVTDHKPLETIFNNPILVANCRVCLLHKINILYE
ncbi:uncharacterized protein LOC114543323 [Dendronephthya gigantea]|uniref:uncharacterized protein LOC114543323 n=1 Tax=Dendronephthya gigantea TaxID=151771 RepID=UPI00106C0E70|nr:uncharacterized protein LOC114543323 [Dendronephthya gigantea]